MQQLRAQGIQVTPHPLVQIVPLSGISTASLLQADAAFFVSQTAVHLAARQLNAPWPKIPCFAVGRSTAMALEQYGAQAIYPAAGSETSEGVLALPQWQQLQQANIVIAQGEGGRSFMAEELSAQGHHVESLVLYRRYYPPINHATIHQWQHTGINMILATSGEIIVNLFQQAPTAAHAWLRQQHWLVPVKRTAKLAEQLGCQQISIMNGANDGAVLATLGIEHSYGANSQGTPTAESP